MSIIRFRFWMFVQRHAASMEHDDLCGQLARRLPDPAESRLLNMRRPVSLHAMLQKWAAKLDKLQSPRTSCSSNQSDDRVIDVEDYPTDDGSRGHSPDADHQLLYRQLRRIEAVRVEHSIRKHRHRYYVLHIYQRCDRVPLHRRDPHYQVEHTYAAFFTLWYRIQNACASNTPLCSSCARRNALLQEDSTHQHGIRRLSRTVEQKQELLEHVLHSLLHIDADQPIDSMLCPGCLEASKCIHEFLRYRYENSTGIL